MHLHTYLCIFVHVCTYQVWDDVLSDIYKKILNHLKLKFHLRKKKMVLLRGIEKHTQKRQFLEIKNEFCNKSIYTFGEKT